MPNNINSASRLVSLLKSIPGHPDNAPTLEVWATLFGVNDLNTNKKAAAVAELLAVMYRELELIREQMQHAGFSESLYASSITRVEHALSTLNLPSTWNNVRQYLTPETLVALSFCGEILPNEETQIESSELTEILTLIDSLQASLTNSQLPPRLKKLVEHHIVLVQRALVEYPISGAKILREAARTALGEIIEEREVVAASRESPEIKKLAVVWKKINDVADIALKVEKLSQIGQKAWSMLESIL